MEVLPLPRCCPTLRGLLIGTPILNKCTLHPSSRIAEAADISLDWLLNGRAPEMRPDNHANMVHGLSFCGVHQPVRCVPVGKAPRPKKR
jgi:hypothetical protein